jgi:DNA-binding MarR family transcriptional regulator
MSSRSHQRATPEERDAALLASELRETLGRLVRRLRAEHRFPLGQGAVLGLLDREGPQSISDLAAAMRVRPQSMAQTVHELEDAALIARRADPDDRRRAFIELTVPGRAALEADRRHREGWLARILADDLSAHERALLHEVAAVLRRIADA